MEEPEVVQVVETESVESSRVGLWLEPSGLMLFFATLSDGKRHFLPLEWDTALEEAETHCFVCGLDVF